MRIMIINTFYYPEILGGTEYSVKKLAEKCVAEGHEVRVLCTGKEYCKEMINNVEVIRIKDGVVVKAADAHHVSKMVKLHRWLQQLWCLANQEMLARELDDYNPDVIHTNGLYDISPIIWKIAQKRGIRVVHTLRDYYLMCPRSSLNCSYAKATCQRPSVICKVYRTINRRSSRYVDVVTAPSSIVLEKLKSDRFFYNSFEQLIPNATDFDEGEVIQCCHERQNRMNDRVLFVFLGSLNKIKGIQWLIESFKKLSDVNAELYIAGKGELLDYVNEASIEDSRIKYVGFLNEEGVSKLLMSCDVLVAPSLWEEPFGRIVLDAYKHAMPVIVSKNGALPTLVEDGKTGLIVDDDSFGSLEEAMSFFIHNPSKIKEFAMNSAEKIKEFSIHLQYKQFLDVYKK